MGDTLPLNRVAIGDIRELAPRIAPNSVNCIVCSPPYMGLRDYGTARWEGGDAGCDHAKPSRQGIATLRPGGTQHHPYPAKGDAPKDYYRDRCGKCGAVRVDRQLGLEPTVTEFVANLVAVFRALRPALRDDGCMFINLGDSYSQGGNGGGGEKQSSNIGSHLPPKRTPGFPPKCLTLAPARFAIAMCDDGWILRSIIRWCKKAAMPESVTDRPTSAVEEIYLFAKSPTYWYDALAVAEPLARPMRPLTWDERRALGALGGIANVGVGGQTVVHGADTRHELGGRDGTRNARNYMLLGPEPFADAHYATFPSAIPRFAIRAGCPPRVCARCGSPWVRVVEKTTHFEGGSGKAGRTAEEVNTSGKWAGMQYGTNIKLGPVVETQTLGWRAVCACGADAGARPGVVLDPFVGSGTTAMVAVEEGRSWLGIDLDERAVTWTAERLAKTQIRLPLDLATEAAGD